MWGCHMMITMMDVGVLLFERECRALKKRGFIVKIRTQKESRSIATSIERKRCKYDVHIIYIYAYIYRDFLIVSICVTPI